MKRTIQWVVLATSTAGAALLALGASACEHDAQATAELECQIICACVSGSDQAACNAGCPQQAANFPVGCQNCIFENSSSCTALEAICQQPCDTNGSGSAQPGSGSGSGSGSGTSAIILACDTICSCEGSNAPANCNSSCETGITSTCAACVNADGTCNAVSNCASSCQ